MVPSRTNGFTLVEILIAMTILAVVMATVYAAYIGTLTLIDETAYGTRVYRMARGSLKRMITDLESVCRYGDAFRFISEEREIRGERVMNLSFVSSAHLDLYEGTTEGIGTIGYYINEEEDEGCTLLREDRLYHRQNTGGELFRNEGFILCEGLRSVIYTFYDRDGDEYDSWDSREGSHKDKIPAIVAIDLSFANPDDDEHPYRFSTQVYLPMVESQ